MDLGVLHQQNTWCFLGFMYLQVFYVHRECFLGGHRKEIHLLTVDSNLDVDKLGRADELANHVGKEGAPLLLAYWRLKAIASSPPEFGNWWRLFSFALSASMSALLFFNGNAI